MTEKKRRTLADGMALISQFKESGLTQRKFAETIGITLCSLQYWMKRLGKSETSQPARFVELSHELGRGDSACAMSIRVGSSITMHFAALPHPEYLAKLSLAMQAQVQC